MSTIESAGSNPYEALGLTTRKETNKESDGLQDQFMTLMLTQMKNQDPLEPMENGEFLAQLAQFNTVSGIQELQKSFSDFASSMQGNQALQASTLVGRDVLVQSNTAQINSGEGVSGVADLFASTTSLKVTVQDGFGQVVRTMDLGQHSAGEVAINWDGRTDSGAPAASGKYYIVAEAAIDGQMQAVTTQIAARVESVTLGQGGSENTLNVVGQGDIAMSQINKIM